MTLLRKIACALDYIKHWLSKDKCKGCKHLELCAWREKDKQLQCGLFGGDWCMGKKVCKISEKEDCHDCLQEEIHKLISEVAK